MEQFKLGDIILINFPFSDLKGKKPRPALVIACAEFEDLILCQITSRPYTSKIAITLKQEDFKEGTLKIESFIRPDKIWTAGQALVIKKLGTLKNSKAKEVINSIVKIIK